MKMNEKITDVTVECLTNGDCGGYVALEPIFTFQELVKCDKVYVIGTSYLSLDTETNKQSILNDSYIGNVTVKTDWLGHKTISVQKYERFPFGLTDDYSIYDEIPKYKYYKLVAKYKGCESEEN